MQGDHLWSLLYCHVQYLQLQNLYRMRFAIAIGLIVCTTYFIPSCGQLSNNKHTCCSRPRFISINHKPCRRT